MMLSIISLSKLCYSRTWAICDSISLGPSTISWRCIWRFSQPQNCVRFFFSFFKWNRTIYSTIFIWPLIKLWIYMYFVKQKRLRKLCRAMLQRIWWQSEALDHFKWTTYFYQHGILIWFISTWKMLQFLRSRQFRDWTLLGCPQYALIPCCCFQCLQEQIPGN